MNRPLIGFMLAMSIATPAIAKSKDPVFVTSTVVKDKPVVALDPASAYILLRSDTAMPLHLMKMPSTEDQRVYDAMRAEKLAKEREKYPARLATFKRDMKVYDDLPKGHKVRRPVEPIEPTDKNFAFVPFNLLSAVSIGPINRFSKQDDGGSVYLQAVTPGQYRIYGLISMIPNSGPQGSCFCMGSVSFEAKAGEVTDMGMVTTRGDASQSHEPMEGELPSLLFRLTPADGNMPVDARIRDAQLQPARYRAVGKLPNYFGVAIERMPEMAGVMRYDRDRIVDLTADGAH